MPWTARQTRHTVTARGAVDFDEIGAMIDASSRGLLILLDLSRGSPCVYVRSPGGPDAIFALALRVDADHYEPIVHHGRCVLREHADALWVMRTVASAPALMPQRILCRGDAPADLLGAKVGGRLCEESGEDCVLSSISAPKTKWVHERPATWLSSHQVQDPPVRLREPTRTYFAALFL